MAKSATKVSLEDVLSAIDSFEVEELAQVKEAAGDKIEGMKHLVVQQFKEDLQRKMSLFGITASDLGLGTPAKAPKRATQRQTKGGPCKICEFETAPAHDARAHKSQGEDKKAFTGKELEERGMSKV